MSHLQADLRAHVRELPSFRLLVMFWGGLAVLDATRFLNDSAQFAAVVVLLALCSRHVVRTTALVLAGIAWLLVNGFVVNDYGQLHWSGLVDATALAVLLVVAMVAKR